MKRPLTKYLDVEALIKNYQYLRTQCGDTRLMVVVKSDAYGHGLIRVAGAVDECDGLAVACASEGAALRSSGVGCKILVLQGCHHDREIGFAREHALSLVVHSREQLQWIEHDGAADLELWVKFDTGMHRLGFPADAHEEIMRRVFSLKKMQIPPVLMSHLACADAADNSRNLEQIDVFDRLCRHYREDGLQVSLANSAAALRLPRAQKDWARMGLAIYGVLPSNVNAKHRSRLKPAMRLVAPVISVRDFGKGDHMGYGSACVCPRAMRVAVVAAGYGDGYPWHAKPGTPVRIAGENCSLVGTVFMDMIQVDIGDARVEVGDLAELWGPNLSVREVSEHCGTIPYSLLCSVTSAETILT